MAEDAPAKGGSALSMLKGKFAGVPVYVWAGVLILIVAYVLHRKKATAPKDSSAAAASQANSNLGSASELANMFNIAGLMPYQGGSVYVNGVSGEKQSRPEKDYSTTTKQVDVTRGESVGQLVADMQKYVKGFSWADFWALNPDIVAKGGLVHQANGDWVFSAESTPVILTKPGQVANPYTFRSGGPITGG